MSDERVTQASTEALTEMALYVMAVADKYGREEALKLMYDTFWKYGSQVGGMLSQQFQGKAATAPEIFAVMAPIFDSVGFGFEITESTPGQVTARFTTCPVAAACYAAGMPTREFCANLGVPLCNAMVQAMNPTAAWAGVRHRESADDYCLEQVTVG
jgi:hypothetical protein